MSIVGTRPPKMTFFNSEEISDAFGYMTSIMQIFAEARNNNAPIDSVYSQGTHVLNIEAALSNNGCSFYRILIHYAMPVRNMIYDALQYGKQVADTAANHRKNDKSFRKCTSGEYLFGFYKEDVLKPVVTLVIHFGADEWDAPLSLYEMMGTQNEKLMHYVQDYQIHLIDPAKLTEEDLKKFTSSLREVIEYIKYSKDKEKLSRILKDNSRMLIDREAALVIKTITNTAIEISEKEEKIDMCKAIDDMLSEREAKGEIRGIEIGEFRMLVKQVKKGRLTIEEAAEDAAMSVEEFRNVTDDMLKEG